MPLSGCFYPHENIFKKQGDLMCFRILAIYSDAEIATEDIIQYTDAHCIFTAVNILFIH